ncbi:hypothetical protein [Spirilliplanes yamanashiensis]|uniref:Uncharacterized protein n=1 Tax=Spirilliplanes yamanashiensis TaxID=42233 RepID=A0A8J3Y633_9ACTN|nr:hypothetical protein [Spirilliplanes yamanashiensis]MDP9814808.1 hypothetical protein [Spirilliplanes yamanashiensis]GIJ02463.1 hypothetical protein Sya03_18150 [Spirilliplanes yamanashiensis]
MDVFSRTFLPATAEAGVPIPTVSRHMPIVRRCVDGDDTTVLVSRCVAGGRAAMLVLTYRRLVVTSETRVMRRLHLHLNTDLRHLSNVTWSPDLRRGGVELAADAVDGVRERFFLRVPQADQVWHTAELLEHVFRGRAGLRTAPVPAHAAAHAEPRLLTGVRHFSPATA